MIKSVLGIGSVAPAFLLMRGVAFELHALFEIDKVELDLLRAAPKREVRDDDVKERRFSGAGFAGEQSVLPRAFANRKLLEFRRASAAN